MINDSSDYRFDAMPFGGFKYGSMGREGVRFAFEEMTQPEIAERVGVSQSYLSRVLRRTLIDLRERMAETTTETSD